MSAEILVPVGAVIVSVIGTSVMTGLRDRITQAREDAALLWSIVNKHWKEWGKDDQASGVPVIAWQAMARLANNSWAAPEQRRAAKTLLGVSSFGKTLDDVEAIKRGLRGSGRTQIAVTGPVDSHAAPPEASFPTPPLTPVAGVVALGLAASFYASGSFAFGAREFSLAAKVLLALAAILATPALVENEAVHAIRSRAQPLGTGAVWLAFAVSIATTLIGLFGHLAGIGEGPNRELTATGLLAAVAVLFAMIFMLQVGRLRELLGADETQLSGTVFSVPTAGIVFLVAVALDFGAAYV